MIQANHTSNEIKKSNLLIQAALLRDQGDVDKSSAMFAAAAEIEESLAEDADRRHDVAKAIQLWYSAESAWAHAGDFHHSVTLLKELEARPDLPAELLARIRAFSIKVHQQREQWHDTLRELASA